MSLFPRNPPAAVWTDDGYDYSLADGMRRDAVVTELAKRAFHPAFLQEYWQKDHHLSELQRQNLDLVRALNEMQHSYYVLSCHLSNSNRDGVWEMNRRLARLLDQMIDKSPSGTTRSRTIAELVSDIETKEKKIGNLERSLREQQAVLEHTSYQLAQMEMVARQQGKQETAKLPYGYPIELSTYAQHPVSSTR